MSRTGSGYEFPSEIKEKILKLRRSGVSARNIAERFGCGIGFPARLEREAKKAEADARDRS